MIRRAFPEWRWHWRPASIAAAVSVLLGMAGALLTSGCHPEAKPGYQTLPPAPVPVNERRQPLESARVITQAAPQPPLVAQMRQEPLVRVRLLAQAPSVTCSGSISLTVGPGPLHQSLAQPRTLRGPVRITRWQQGFAIAAPGSAPMGWNVPSLSITTGDGRPVLVDGVAYPGMVVVHARVDAPAALDVINHVALESYLPGVLEKELYRNWHPGAFAAQAIAARSYAVCQAHRYQARHFDLEAGVASQAYVGASVSAKASEAARRTRGMLLAWDGRVVPAYYSSCCGGTSQDAAFAFPEGENIPPLRGGREDRWCQNASTFRWGPMRRDFNELTIRMAAWGAANKHPVAGLRALREVRVAANNSAGRPIRFMVIDQAGQQYYLGAEQFRFACNMIAPGLGAAPAALTLKSSFVRLRNEGRTLLIEEGRGHGHGVGMCQWGAQGMAQAGVDPIQILQAYYPGATVVQPY